LLHCGGKLQLPLARAGQGISPLEAAQVTEAGGCPPKVHVNEATLFCWLPLEKATAP